MPQFSGRHLFILFFLHSPAPRCSRGLRALILHTLNVPSQDWAPQALGAPAWLSNPSFPCLWRRALEIPEEHLSKRQRPNRQSQGLKGTIMCRNSQELQDYAPQALGECIAHCPTTLSMGQQEMHLAQWSRSAVLRHIPAHLICLAVLVSSLWEDWGGKISRSPLVTKIIYHKTLCWIGCRLPNHSFHLTEKTQAGP